MLRRSRYGCLLLLVTLGVVGYAAVALPVLPWWAVVFGVLFYAALVRRLRAGRGDVPGVDAGPDDTRTPFPMFRNRGF